MSVSLGWSFGSLILALLSLILPHGCQETSLHSKPITSREHVVSSAPAAVAAGDLAIATRDPVPASSKPAPKDKPLCREKKPQTGPGCDMAGMQKAVKQEISPSGSIGLCYKNNEPSRKKGRLTFKVVLRPDGTAASVGLQSDGIGNHALADCLRGAMADIRYPAPGDVPCTLIYPLNFQ